MKKLILKMSVTIDGFVAGPKGELDWVFRTESDDADQWAVDMLWNASLHLMGRRTYEDMAAWWPTAKGEFAPVMNEIPKAVFSRLGVRAPGRKRIDQLMERILTTTGLKRERATYQGATASAHAWESWLHPRICTGRLATEIKRLKRGAGKPLVAHGGASFARSLIGTGLIDEYQLLVHPVVLGRGLPLFSDVRRPFDLTLSESIRFRSGAVAQIYRP